MTDTINPQHYKGVDKDGCVLEVIDVIEAFGLQGDYYLATAIKYILRAGKKSGSPFDEDVNKAIWFLNRAKWFRTVFKAQTAWPLPDAAQSDLLADGIESGRE